MPTPRDILNDKQNSSQAAFIWRGNDGLLVGFLKVVFGLPFWRLPFQLVVGGFLRLVRRIDKQYEERIQALRCFWLASDVYILCWTSLLIIIYGLAFSVKDSSSTLVVAAGMLSAFRVFEILSMLIELHASEGYRTDAPVRAVVNTVWHYPTPGDGHQGEAMQL